MGDWDKIKMLAIGGPTASGKTALSVKLAKRLNGEIICADSMQIYKGLDVGTAKVTQEEMQGVPHHLVGFLEPSERFSVADYVHKAQDCIEAIAERGKLPILVGGTGLYIQSLLYGVKFSEQPGSDAVRQQLQQQAEELGAEAMHQQLMKIDPLYASTVHPNNVGRVIRALELYQVAGITMTQQRERSLPSDSPYNSILLCPCYENRQTLYQRIDLRVLQMMEQGLLDEARWVYENQPNCPTAAQAIGYKEFFPFFEGAQTQEECVAKLQQASRNYAKRQLTWFKRMPETQWLYADEGGVYAQAMEQIGNKWPGYCKEGL